MTCNVGIYLFPEIEVLDFAGPYEVFTTATRVAARQNPTRHSLLMCLRLQKILTLCVQGQGCNLFLISPSIPIQKLTCWLFRAALSAQNWKNPK